MNGSFPCLLALIEILLRNCFPVAGAVLATELGITARILYRDMRTLKEQGSAVDMEFGYTFVARDPGGHRLRVFAVKR